MNFKTGSIPFLSAAICGWTFSLFAQFASVDTYSPGSSCSILDCCSGRSEAYVGIVSYATSFKVGNNGFGLDETFGYGHNNNEVDGNLFGAVVGYTYRGDCNLYLNGEFEWAVGGLHGSRECIGDLPSQCLHNYFAKGRLGYNFLFDYCENCYSFTPYVGIGYHYTQQNVSHGGGKYNYYNWFGILGGKIDWLFNERFSVGLDAEWFLPCEAHIRLKEVGRIHVGRGTGYQVEMPLRFNFTRCCKNYFVTLAPFYRRIVYDRSRVHTCGIESYRIPQVCFQDYGAKLYAGICF